MPLYEYRCNECGNTFEVLVFSEDEDIKCPNCGSKNVEKLISSFSSLSPSCSSGGFS